MDRFIAALPGEVDGDLTLCRDHGVAYQTDRTHLVSYDADYYEKFSAHDADITEKVNAGRIALVAKHFGSGPMVDVGIGNGEFIKRRPNTWGHDVNPVGIEWLKRNDLWADRLRHFQAVSMFDVLEHVNTPEDYLSQIPPHGFLFCSIPIIYALGAIRSSKHYRPGEHLYYFEDFGFVAWMDRHGFKLLERDDFEIRAGRESIYSYSFQRNRWPT